MLSKKMVLIGLTLSIIFLIALMVVYVSLDKFTYLSGNKNMRTIFTNVAFFDVFVIVYFTVTTVFSLALWGVYSTNPKFWEQYNNIFIRIITWKKEGVNEQ